MRIIHNIGPKESIQMTVSGHAYRGRIGTESEWQGWFVELLITSRDALSQQEQPIEIEGNGDDVIHALETAVVMLKGYGADLREQFEKGINVNPPNETIIH